MAQQEIRLGQFLAGSDLRTHANKFVVLTSGKLAVCGAGAGMIGVLFNAPEQDQPGHVQNAGIAQIVAGAAVSAGALVQSDASGRAITATTGNFIGGRALESAAAAGEIIEVLLSIGNAKA